MITHTKEKWTLENTTGRTLRVTAGPKGFVIAEVTSDCIAHFIGNTDEALANAKLIEAAPGVLKELILTYLRLQIESDKEVSFAITTDYMRASLRNKIARVLDVEDIELQNKIESIARDYVDNKIDFIQAIKKATE